MEENTGTTEAADFRGKSLLMSSQPLQAAAGQYTLAQSDGTDGDGNDGVDGDGGTDGDGTDSDGTDGDTTDGDGTD
jgi:hypothetical protein